MSFLEKTRTFARRDKVYDFLMPEPVFDDNLDTPWTYFIFGRYQC